VKRFTDTRGEVIAFRPPPLTRRLEIRISATEAGAPFGRSIAFRLQRRDVDELIAHAARLEWRP
jgi:hypothetical protein